MVVRHGSFRRRCDSQLVRRFRCRRCGSGFSDSSGTFCYRQRKRQVNRQVFELLVSNCSQRRAAKLLRLNRKTIARKFLLMGEATLNQFSTLNRVFKPASVLEFDDLETFEHTKCKPISVTIAVDSESRRIIGFKLAKIPARGKLAQIAYKKYGSRTDERNKMRNILFDEIKNYVKPDALIKSDCNPHYIKSVRTHFPKATYKQYRSRTPKAYGLGELKTGKFDPIFSINHTLAMFRANISRLTRKTWCTTKNSKFLAYHIAMYSAYHNFAILSPICKNDSVTNSFSLTY